MMVLNTTSLRLLVLLAVPLTVLIVGVGVDPISLPAEDEPDGEQLIKDVLDGGEWESMTATRVSEDTRIRANGSQRTIVERRAVWTRQPDHHRSEVLSTNSNVTEPGEVYLVNGSTRIWYYPEEPFTGDRELRYIENDSVDVGPTMPRNVSPDVLDQLEVAYVGTETIDGRETYVVEMEPETNASAVASLSLLVGDHEFELVTAEDQFEERENVTITTTWWIDTEITYPIKERINTTNHDRPDDSHLQETSIQTTTYRNVTVNTTISDERFTIDPPEETEVIELERDGSVLVPAEVQRYDPQSVAEADELAPFAVPEPAIPDRFERTGISAEQVQGNMTVEIDYREGGIEEIEPEDDIIRLRISEDPTDYDEDDIVREGLGEVNASAAVSGTSGSIVTYHCNGVEYRLTVNLKDGEQEFVPEVSDDEVELGVEIAESMGCSR